MKCSELAGGEHRASDYFDANNRMNLGLLEQHHFGPDVRNWDPSKPQREGIFGDLHYTLRAVPNHYPALQTLISAYLKKKSSVPIAPECYFYRAIVFRPNDAAVYALFGVYMHRRGDHKFAVKLYEQALALRPDNPEVHYNLGLALTDLGRYTEARSHAEQAYARGHPLPGLRNRLKRAGHWGGSSEQSRPQGASD